MLTSPKFKLTDFDRAGLIGLVKDLYSASKDNQAFLYARLGIGGDHLKPYKATISRWVCPDVMRNQDISVAKAKKAIADYRKAIGRPGGMAEIFVSCCEEVFTFLSYCGTDDEGYYSAVVRMFEQALKSTIVLPKPQRDDFFDRLEAVRVAGQGYGWGMGRRRRFKLALAKSRAGDRHVTTAVCGNFVGNWRITEMEAWDADYFDMEVPAYLTIRKDLTGEFQFGLMQAQLDGKIELADASPRVAFSWSGFDENDPVNGRGWLHATGDQAEGQIFIRLGDESGFKAERTG